jgi:hypothetical protein
MVPPVRPVPGATEVTVPPLLASAAQAQPPVPLALSTWPLEQPDVRRWSRCR